VGQLFPFPAPLAHSSVTTFRQLNQSFLTWIEVVYHPKLHTETGQAPLERFRQDPAPATRSADPQALRQAFLHRDQRKVTQTATFSFRRNRYRVPATFFQQEFPGRHLWEWTTLAENRWTHIGRELTSGSADLTLKPVRLCRALPGTTLWIQQN
jgi:hypothetical protein